MNDFIKLIDKNFNKWPLIDYYTGNNFTTSEKILNLFKIGIEPFFILDVRTNIFNNSNYTLWVCLNKKPKFILTFVKQA